VSISEAVIDAAVQRFRPILMTSLATVVWGTAIALGLGRRPGADVDGNSGLLADSLFAGDSLVVPALYTYLFFTKAAACRSKHNR